MTVKQQIDTTVKAAYLMNVSYPVESAKNKTFRFQDSDLIVARQAAIKKLQQIATEKQAYEVIDASVQLIEIDRCTVGALPVVIATVFHHHFCRTMFVEKGKDLLEDLQFNEFTKKSLPKALFSTIGLGGEACNPQELGLQIVSESPEELAYYQQHGYSINVPQHQE